MTKSRFLLDSNICIYIVDGSVGALKVRLEQCEPEEIVTSAIAYAEVMRGIRPDDAERIARAERLFSLFEVLPFDQMAALRYRTMPFKRGSYDRLIAAHAVALGLTLITNNESDFADIPGLKIENWTVAC